MQPARLSRQLTAWFSLLLLLLGGSTQLWASPHAAPASALAHNAMQHSEAAAAATAPQPGQHCDHATGQPRDQQGSACADADCGSVCAALLLPLAPQLRLQPAYALTPHRERLAEAPPERAYIPPRGG